MTIKKIFAAAFFAFFAAFCFAESPEKSSDSNKEIVSIPLTDFYHYDFGTSYSDVFASMSEKGFQPVENVIDEKLVYEKIDYDNGPHGKNVESDLTFVFKDGKLDNGTAFFPLPVEGKSENAFFGPVLKIIDYYSKLYDKKKKKMNREDFKKEHGYVLWTCGLETSNEKSFIMKIYQYKEKDKDSKKRPDASLTAYNYKVDIK